MLFEILEISVKHDINDIDSRTAHSEDAIITSEQWKSIDLNVLIKIEKFPSEFKKNIFKTIDLRFSLILLFSVVLNVGTILILKKVVPSELTTKTISRIQEQYAKILLNNEFPDRSYFGKRTKSDYILDTELVTGLNRWLDVFTNDVLESIKETPAFNKSVSASGSKETRLPSKEEFGVVRKSATANRLASREELEKEVNSVGLLGLISSNTRSIDHEYVQDLLEYASENSTHLTEVLARLSSIEVPRHGNTGYLKKIRQNDADDESTELKGGRTSATDEIRQVIKNVEPIEAVETKPMKRNVQYEEVPSGDMSKLTDAMVRGKTRSAQDVLRIVQSHTRALQDCYKQELRYDSGINGKIVVRFTIDVDGNVKNASVITSSLNSPRMEECILNRIKRWRNFPPCDPSVGDKTYRQSFSFGKNNQ
jgi:TonB family protein